MATTEGECNIHETDDDTISSIESVLHIPKVFDQILEYLPTKDLQGARLINHQWNSQIVSILSKKRNVLIHLHAENIKQYLDFIRSPEYELGRTFNFKISLSSCEEVKIDDELKELINEFGPYCIKALQSDTCLDLEILKILAPDLEKLKIDIIRGDLKDLPQFPRLISLECVEIKHGLEIIVNKTPNLTKLKLHGIRGPTDYVLLKRLKNSLPRLEVFEVLAYSSYDDLMESIDGVQFPRLVKLGLAASLFSADANEESTDHCLQLMARCPRLKSLEFGLVLMNHDHDYDSEGLGHLEHGVGLIRTIMSPMLFAFITIEDIKQGSNMTLTLRNAKLEPNWETIFKTGSHKHIVHQLSLLYPALKKLKIVNNSPPFRRPNKELRELCVDEAPGATKFRMILNELWKDVVRHSVYHFRVLEELEIYNYYEDCFSDMMGQYVDIYYSKFPKRRNMQKLTLYSIEPGFKSLLKTGIPRLDLTSLQRLFPSLQALKVGEEFFGFDTSSGAADKAKFLAKHAKLQLPAIELIPAFK